MRRTKKPEVTWLLRRDIAGVLDMLGWSPRKLCRRLAGRSTLGMVVREGDAVSACMIYEYRPGQAVIRTLAVRPECRRRGFGTLLVTTLKDRVGNRRTVVASVGERNLRAQKFFQACGSRAVKVRRGHKHDRYIFAWRSSVCSSDVKRKVTEQ